jgi:hypothetical protein
MPSSVDAPFYHVSWRIKLARVEIEYDNYKVKAFLDTNIILEGRPIPELPWHEIDPEARSSRLSRQP